MSTDVKPTIPTKCSAKSEGIRPSAINHAINLAGTFIIILTTHMIQCAQLSKLYTNTKFYTYSCIYLSRVTFTRFTRQQWGLAVCVCRPTIILYMYIYMWAHMHTHTHPYTLMLNLTFVRTHARIHVTASVSHLYPIYMHHVKQIIRGLYSPGIILKCTVDACGLTFIDGHQKSNNYK